jgi:UDP-glucose 4-epimerase
MTEEVLITGGLGYLGGRIAQALSKNPRYSVHVTTRDAACVPPPFLTPGRCRKMDLMKDNEVAAACEGMDAIVHLAAMNEHESAADPAKALLVNGVGTLKLLEAATAAGIRRFIYFSTAHIYRSPLAGTITEETLPRPIHPYAITHRVAEDLVLSTRERGLLEAFVIRLSNGIGAPVRPDVNRWTLVGNDLCRQVVTDQTLRLSTSGLQERDFIPLSDVAGGVDHLLALTEDDAGNGIFNLGGECTMTILALANLIRERCKVVLDYTPTLQTRGGDKDHSDEPLVYSINKLKATGFHLEGRIEDEIDATLAFCYKHFYSKS